MAKLAYSTYLRDGEVAAEFATVIVLTTRHIMLIEPERTLTPDIERTRKAPAATGFVWIATGAAIGYYVRSGHFDDYG